MQAIMISIHPKWCELIASGKKTVEVRKTRPKIETPFKCYIYETKGKQNFRPLLTRKDTKYIKAEGKSLASLCVMRLKPFAKREKTADLFTR